jgi:hypothetical protein
MMNGEIIICQNAEGSIEPIGITDRFDGKADGK